MKEKLERCKKLLDDFKGEVLCAEPLLENIPVLREHIKSIIDEIQTESAVIEDETIKQEARRLYCNLWAIDHMYFSKINGQPLVKTDDDIRKNIAGWLKTLIYRIENYKF
jgi:citrate synthase